MGLKAKNRSKPGQIFTKQLAPGDQKCNYSITKELCDSEAGSFADHCRACKKFN